MKNSTKSIIGFVFFFLFLWISSALCFAAGDAIVVNMSYNGPPDAKKNAVHLYAINFKTDVEKKTAGKLEIKLYPNSQLGNEEQRMEHTMSGPMINIASFAGVAPVFPEIFASNIPFMFNSYEAAHHFFDKSQWWEKASREFLKRTGVVMVTAVEEGGFLAFTNSKKPVHSPADFKGLKFRAMDESQVALYEAFGASGTPIPWTELYMALKTGVADGQMNPPMYIIIGSLFEVQNHVCMANVQYSDQFLLINNDWLSSLPDQFRKAVLDTAHVANRKNRTAVESQVDDRVEFLKTKGMTVYHPNMEEMAAFRDIGQPSYLKWLEAKMDKSWIELALKDAAEANQAAQK